MLETTLLKDGDLALSNDEISMVAEQTAGYSCSDIFELCREASTVRLRELKLWELDPSVVKDSDVRSIMSKDFATAMGVIRSSVPLVSLRQYYEWNNRFGSSKVLEDSFLVNINDKIIVGQEEIVGNANGDNSNNGIMNNVFSSLRQWFGFQNNKSGSEQARL